MPTVVGRPRTADVRVGQGKSSGRLDALVWAVWALVLEPVGIAWAM